MLKEVWGFVIGFKKSIEYKNLYLQWTFFYDLALIILYVMIYSMLDEKRSMWFYLSYILIMTYTSLYSPWKFRDVINDIKKGDLTQYLTKPFGYLAFRFFYFIGLDVRAIIFMLITLLIFFPNPTNIAIFFLVLPWMIIIEFLLMTIIVSFAFWIYETKHLFNIANNIRWFLTGSILPYTFFPEHVRNILDFLPYAYIGYLRFDVLINGINSLTPNFFAGLIGNILILSIILYILWNKGLKRFESQGG